MIRPNSAASRPWRLGILSGPRPGRWLAGAAHRHEAMAHLAEPAGACARGHHDHGRHCGAAPAGDRGAPVAQVR
jgi:hypothetical protein